MNNENSAYGTKRNTNGSLELTWKGIPFKGEIKKQGTIHSENRRLLMEFTSRNTRERYSVLLYPGNRFVEAAGESQEEIDFAETYSEALTDDLWYLFQQIIHSHDIADIVLIDSFPETYIEDGYMVGFLELYPNSFPFTLWIEEKTGIKKYQLDVQYYLSPSNDCSDCGFTVFCNGRMKYDGIGYNTETQKIFSFTDDPLPEQKEIESLIDLFQEKLRLSWLIQSIQTALRGQYLIWKSKHITASPKKTRRNDPCPCGSGKKYKHCCLNNPKLVSFQKSPATIMDQTADLLRNRNFDSEEELKSFLSTHLGEQGKDPQYDYMGLTPIDMYEIMNNPVEELHSLVIINNNLTPEEVKDSLIIQMSQFFLKTYQNNNGSVSLSAGGSYPPDLLQTFLKDFFPDRVVSTPLENEKDIPLIEVLHSGLSALGIIRETKTESILSEKGIELLETGRWGKFYYNILLWWMKEVNWQTFLPEKLQSDYFFQVQNSALLSLFIIHKKMGAVIHQPSLYEHFLNAYPEFDPVYKEDEEAWLGEKLYGLLLINSFGLIFGFFEIPDDFDDIIFGDEKFQVNPLFSKVFQWQK